MKHFTVEQANRTLPLVRRIVADIVRAHERWRETVSAFELVSARVRAGNPDPEADRLQQDAGRLAEDIAACVRELEELGVEFKGYDLGLVDFPARAGDRDVYLCWRLGEPAVQYWHETSAGYAARRPIALLASNARPTNSSIAQ